MNKNSSLLKGALAWVGIVIIVIFLYKMTSRQEVDVRTETYSEFSSRIEKYDPQTADKDNPIMWVTIKSDFTEGDDISVEYKNKTRVVTYAPFDSDLRTELRERLKEKEIKVNFDRPDRDKGWTSFLGVYLPLILVVGFMFFFLRNMQGAGGKAMSFGKSKAKMLSDNMPKITFKDVAGVEEVKQECAEIIDFLKDHKKFQEMGARIPKGVLMMGQPGTGKTLLARAIAGEAGVPFFHISGSDFVEMFVGVGASRVRDLFDNAKKNAPCIVFIDEIDAVGRHRGAGVGGGHDEREQTLNQLLVEMDGFESNEAIIVIAATNRPDVLDPALLRAGRFDRRVVVNLPDVRGRKEILNVYINKIKADKDVDPEKIALGTPGFSGADLENLVNEAALIAVRNGQKVTATRDLEAAKDKILMGPERKNMVMSKETVVMTAYHETGHALVGYYLKSKSNVHKVTIIPRGRALGVTVYIPKEDIYSESKEDLLMEIARAMAGRAAEEIKFGQFTTGASNDISQATSIARAMVCEFGMSKLGPINFGQKHGSPFLGRDWNEQRNYSEGIANEIDAQVSLIINAQYELARKTLMEHMEVFERVANVLVEVETLDSAEFVAVVNGASVEEIRDMQRTKVEGPNPALATPPTEEQVPATSESIEAPV